MRKIVWKLTSAPHAQSFIWGQEICDWVCVHFSQLKDIRTEGFVGLQPYACSTEVRLICGLHVSPGFECCGFSQNLTQTHSFTSGAQDLDVVRVQFWTERRNNTRAGCFWTALRGGGLQRQLLVRRCGSTAVDGQGRPCPFGVLGQTQSVVSFRTLPSSSIVRALSLVSAVGCVSMCVQERVRATEIWWFPGAKRRMSRRAAVFLTLPSSGQRRAFRLKSSQERRWIVWTKQHLLQVKDAWPQWPEGKSSTGIDDSMKYSPPGILLLRGQKGLHKTASCLLIWLNYAWNCSNLVIILPQMLSTTKIINGVQCLEIKHVFIAIVDRLGNFAKIIVCRKMLRDESIHSEMTYLAIFLQNNVIATVEHNAISASQQADILTKRIIVSDSLKFSGHILCTRGTCKCLNETKRSALVRIWVPSMTLTPVKRPDRTTGVGGSRQNLYAVRECCWWQNLETFLPHFAKFGVHQNSQVSFSLTISPAAYHSPDPQLTRNLVSGLLSFCWIGNFLYWLATLGTSTLFNKSKWDNSELALWIQHDWSRPREPIRTDPTHSFQLCVRSTTKFTTQKDTRMICFTISKRSQKK